MPKRKPYIPPILVAERATAELNGVQFEKGDYFRLRREPGQVFKFLGLRRPDFPTSQWYVSAYGGDKSPKGRQQFRAFRLEELFIKTEKPYQKKEIDE